MVETFNMIADRLGVPVAVLVFVGIGLWITIRWVGNKVLLPISESHISLVNSAKETNALNSRTLDKMTTILEAKGGTLEKISNQNDQILVLANKNHDLISGLKKEGGTP